MNSIQQVQKFSPFINPDRQLLLSQIKFDKKIKTADDPLVAFSAGSIEVYGNEEDQIKRDVVSLMLWGF